MKIGIISDIHGNFEALVAVLKDIESEKCDKIWCLGDLAMAGPEPDKLITYIKKLYNEGRLDLIQGNTDEMIANFSEELALKVKQAYPVMGNALENDVKIISVDNKSFLKTLDKQKSIEIEGVKVLLVHGSPRKNDENITSNLTIDKLDEMLVGVDEEVIFCGHTHVPCGYQASNKKTVINVGSVGRPFTPEPQSCYVVAGFFNGEFDVMHKFVDYDKQKASEKLSKRDFDGADKLAEMLIKPVVPHI